MDTQTDTSLFEQMLRAPAMKRAVGCKSDATLLTWEKTIPGFPQRRKIGPNSVGWLASEVLQFLRSCPVERGRRPDKAIEASLRRRAEAIEGRRR